jgi:hypothetical protein
MIGWQWKRASKGGPAFVLINRGALGSLKVTERFPLTPEGWASAWRSYVKENPDAADKCRARLKEREREQRELDQRSRPTSEMAVLDSRSLACLRQVGLLGGYAPDSAIAIGERYDARFLEDRLGIFPCHHWEPLAELPYSEVEDVEIGGPGLVRSGGGFIGGGFGAVGALEGMTIAAVLNALTARTSITTIARVQATSCELFLLFTSQHRSSSASSCPAGLTQSAPQEPVLSRAARHKVRRRGLRPRPCCGQACSAARNLTGSKRRSCSGPFRLTAPRAESGSSGAAPDVQRPGRTLPTAIDAPQLAAASGSLAPASAPTLHLRICLIPRA